MNNTVFKERGCGFIMLISHVTENIKISHKKYKNKKRKIERMDTHTDTQTHRTTSVTLAAHARQGLTTTT